MIHVSNPQSELSRPASDVTLSTKFTKRNRYKRSPLRKDRAVVSRTTRQLLALPDSRAGSHCPLRRTVRYKKYAQREMELRALKAASHT